MQIDTAAIVAEQFLNEYTSSKRFFSEPDVYGDPKVIVFSVVEDETPDTLLVTFGLRPSEDTYNPPADIVAIADDCIQALRTAHPELAPLRLVVDYAN
jgi:hypothetical protein